MKWMKNMVSEIESAKVYIYILKTEASNKEIYGYTVDKETAKLFETQRNMNLFYKITKQLDKYELMAFMNKNKNAQIIKDYLYDGKGNIEVATTIHESNCLDESCEQIHSTMLFIKDEIENFPFKKKYLNLIKELTDSLIKDDDNIYSLNINTFKMFYYLFKKTFYEESNEEDSLY